jgi:hypothetical protein
VISCGKKEPFITVQEEQERLSHRPNFSRLAPGHVLLSIVVSVICPYLLASELSQRGASWQVLLLVALFPLGGILYTFIRLRVLDILGVSALVVILTNLLVHFFSASIPDYTVFRAFLWGGPFAVLALVTLLSQGIARPFFFSVDRFFSAGDDSRKLAQYDAIWSRSDRYRGWVRRQNMLWGIAQMLLAGVIGGLTLLVPGWSDQFDLLLICVAYGGLGFWTQQRKTGALWDGEEMA